MLDYKSACITTVTHGTDVGDILPEGRVGLFQRDGGFKNIFTPNIFDSELFV
jgi:hypothetical protein